MSYMSIDINSLKDIEKRVNSLSKSIEKIKSSLSSVRSNIDSTVRNRSGIDSSMSSLIREVGERERIMNNVKQFLNEAVKQYEDMEKELRRESDRIIANSAPKTGIIKSILNGLKSIGKKLGNLLKTIAKNSILLSPVIIGTPVVIIGKILAERGFIVTNEPTEIIKRDDKGIPILEGILSYSPFEFNPYVVLLQKRLIELGYGDGIKVNGKFDSKTLKAVNKYKEDYGLWNFGEYEGKVGETTWNHMFNNEKVPYIGDFEPTDDLISDDVPPLSGILSYNPNVYSEEVLMMQRRLNEIFDSVKGYKKIKEDGYFGPETLAAVNRYKDFYKLWNHEEYKGVVGETTWRHMFTLKPEDRAKLFETKPEDGQQKVEQVATNPAGAGGETSRAGGNPSYTDIVNYIKQICADIGLPEDIGFAIAWTESGMTQFNNDGNTKRNDNIVGGCIDSSDWGIMQINDKSWRKSYDIERIKTDWRYNIECGLKIALISYKMAIESGEENIARATYSGYNAGTLNISRYRTKNDNRDENFWNYYQNKPWNEYVESLDAVDPSSIPATKEARCEFIFGKPGVTRYDNPEEAKKHMVTVTVDVWKIDKNGQKYPSKETVQVNEKLGEQVKQIFTEIFNSPEKFPIKSIGGYRWDEYDGHPAGAAIDINWEENWCRYKNGTVVGNCWDPKNNDYSMSAEGSVVTIFKKYGWGWGGDWDSPQDYMHLTYLMC
jgi:peptidoglycan hydrolase-like protein with peptidoglycan-binding domain